MSRGQHSRPDARQPLHRSACAPGPSASSPRTASHDGDLHALLMLRVLPVLDDVRRRALLDKHGSPRSALRAARERLAGRYDPAVVASRAERAVRGAAQVGARILGIRDPQYPARLLELADAPTVLFALGDASLLDRPAVAIVGTRRHTAYGCEVAGAIAGPLARAGFAVVSGLAFGIDCCAHEAALEAGGATIAFVGSGVDVVYPREHTRLATRIAQAGLIVSEFLPGEPALRHHFPRRNRLIAAQSLGVLVVEAPLKSGALITVRHATDLGREVFAVPGPVGRESSAGTNALLRDGATFVTEALDVVSELWPQMTPAHRSQVRFDRFAEAAGAERSVASGTAPGLDASAIQTTNPVLGALWSALDVEPQHVDDLARATGLSHGEALAGLLDLELTDRVRQVPGQRFARRLAA